MEIDLNDIPIGVAETERELNILKSAKLYKELKEVKSDFNFLIVSVSILNILEHHQYFTHQYLTEDTLDGIYLIGDFYSMKVYVDPLMHPNQMVLSYDKQIMRDSKLDFILNDVDAKNELVINVYD